LRRKINHQQHGSIGQFFRQVRGGKVRIAEVGVFARELVCQSVDASSEIAWTLTQGYPQNAIRKGGPHPLIVAECLGQRGFAEASRSRERGGEGD
jgi:hypothetical protein